MPDTEVIRKDLATFTEQKGLQLQYSTRPTERQRQARPRKEDNPNYRTCPEAFVNQLKTRRYSPNTIRTYTDLFEEFINRASAVITPSWTLRRSVRRTLCSLCATW